MTGRTLPHIPRVSRTHPPPDENVQAMTDAGTVCRARFAPSGDKHAAEQCR